MVGRVRVRGQGPVRRGQTTTTFKKGGRVKLMSGGNPHRRTKEEKLDDMWKKVYGKRATRKKTRHVKPMAKGGRVTKLARTLSDTVAKDVRDSRKKLNVHQDPRSGLAASLRFHRDNPPKKKPIRSPHTDDPKKRTLRDKYFEHLKPRKPRSKSNPRPFLGGLRPGVPLRRKK
jgi:hypothetical protein